MEAMRGGSWSLEGGNGSLGRRGKRADEAVKRGDNEAVEGEDREAWARGWPKCLWAMRFWALHTDGPYDACSYWLN